MIIVHDFKIERKRLNNYVKNHTGNKNKAGNNNGSDPEKSKEHPVGEFNKNKAHNNNDSDNGNNTVNELKLEEDIIHMAIAKSLSNHDLSFINNYSVGFKIIIIKKSLDLRQRIGKSVFLFALEIKSALKGTAVKSDVKDEKNDSTENYMLNLLLKSGFKARIASEKEEEIYHLNSSILCKNKAHNKFSATNYPNEFMPSNKSVLSNKTAQQPIDDISISSPNPSQSTSEYETLKLSADEHKIYNLPETKDHKADSKPSLNKNLNKINKRKPSVVIIGMGPAGIFAAVELLKNGIKPIIIEKGKKVEDRQKDVEQFFNNALFNPQSNIVFGEGGAGTFSDGKLTTRKKDYYVGYCMDFMVRMGADKNILTENRPHIGSDILIEILKNIRRYLIDNGAELRFEEELKEIIIFNKNHSEGNYIANKKLMYNFQNGVNVNKNKNKNKNENVKVNENGKIHENIYKNVSINENENVKVNENVNSNVSLKLDDIKTDKETINADYLILAAGANNFKLYKMLFDKGLKMEQKPFAVGFRIEHKREFIDRILSRDNQKLSSLYYNLSSKKYGGYSFCMCPGGVVVGASSEEGHLCINGMSYSGRDLDNSNSAIVTTIMPADLSKVYNCILPDNTAGYTNNKYNGHNNKENRKNKKDDSLAMLEFRQDLEKKAFSAGGNSFSAPFQYTTEYIEDIYKNYNYKYKNYFKNIKNCKNGYSSNMPVPSYRPEVTRYELFKLLPEFINIKLAGTLTEFNEKFHGFIENSVLTGIEAGTSSAVRILRNEDYQSINVEGIYPCGEGSGYSGGIITSAIDGVKCARSIIEKIIKRIA